MSRKKRKTLSSTSSSQSQSSPSRSDGGGRTEEAPSTAGVEKPLSLSDVSEDARTLFNRQSTHWELSGIDEDLEGMSEDQFLFQTTTAALEQCPELSRIVNSDGESLLFLALNYIGEYNQDQEDEDQEARYSVPQNLTDAVKLLIEPNPHALSWGSPHTNKGILPIQFVICECPSLIRWIVETHIAQFEKVQRMGRPAWILLMFNYAKGGISPRQVRAFFEAYPQGLHECNEYRRLPLHLALEYNYFTSFEENDLELIRFMLETYPEAARCLDDWGNTPLRHAAISLARSETADITIPKICSLLIEAYPKAVSLSGRDGVTPLRTLLKRYGNPKIHPVLVAMLRIVYPKPVPDNDRYSTFLQRMNGLLKDEAKLSQNCVNINRVQTMLQKKVADDLSPSLSSADPKADDTSSSSAEILQIYSLWATDNRKTATARIQSFRNVDIPKALQDFQFQDDVYDDDDSDDNDDSDDVSASTDDRGSSEEDVVIDLLESSSDGEEENES